MNNILFQTINWDTKGIIVYQGKTGIAYWQTMNYNGLRVRIVEYTAKDIADHWCQ